MTLIPAIVESRDEMTRWRRDIHAHPETAFEERRTSDLVAQLLESFGVEVHRGIAKTGVVGVLRAGSSSKSIGLRADMDGLFIEEANLFVHRSRNAGKMHACGHDGHTAMLLGAARYLARTKHFDGTVVFVFQPAEENEGGGRVMVDEGLFTRFPVDGIYGMHNMPGLGVGKFAFRVGPMMACYDVFEILLKGRGGHPAQPQHARDPIVAGSALVQALQTIRSRDLNPLDGAVVSVTQFKSGETWNVIPSEIVMRGTARAYSAAVQDRIEEGIRRIAHGIAEAHGVVETVRYERRYPAVVNAPGETETARQVLEGLVGAEHVDANVEPRMTAEDFAFMLQAKAGCYVFIGNGDGPDARRVHNPEYDFNDEILPLGASYWARLVEHVLRPA